MGRFTSSLMTALVSVRVGARSELRRVAACALMLSVASISASPHRNRFPKNPVFNVWALTLPQSMARKFTKTGYGICTARCLFPWVARLSSTASCRNANRSPLGAFAMRR